jgi:hypothetical protein
MDAQTIVNVLDNQLPRGDTVEGRVTWLGHRGRKFTALIDNDGDVLFVAYELRPGVIVERKTKWSQPYGYKGE